MWSLAKNQQLAPLLLWLLGCCLFLSSCSGTSSSVRKRVLTRADIESLSQALTTEIEREYEPLSHEVVNRYVDELGQSIVAHNSNMPPLPYRFVALRTNEAFAFSIPGGKVYLGLGMFKLLDLEGQLAAALAHELAHQDLGHPLQVWRDRVLGIQKNALVRSQDLGVNFEQLYFGPTGLLAFDATMEQEADQNAMVLLYEADFDPRVYVSYLQALQEVKTESRVQHLLSMHPDISERINWSRQFLRNLPPKRESKLTSAVFLSIKRKLNLAIREERRRSKKNADTISKQK